MYPGPGPHTYIITRATRRNLVIPDPGALNRSKYAPGLVSTDPTYGTPTKRQVSKRQVSKRLVSKRPVFKFDILLSKKYRNCQVCIAI